ncbi:MAG: hypothetical protein Q4G30_03625 [Actinomycetaceae bacterium]|nr:hypothetical protein [Actinomycetaceae bacterium]
MTKPSGEEIPPAPPPGPRDDPNRPAKKLKDLLDDPERAADALRAFMQNK